MFKTVIRTKIISGNSIVTVINLFQTPAQMSTRKKPAIPTAHCMMMLLWGDPTDHPPAELPEPSPGSPFAFASSPLGVDIPIVFPADFVELPGFLLGVVVPLGFLLGVFGFPGFPLGPLPDFSS